MSSTRSFLQSAAVAVVMITASGCTALAHSPASASRSVWQSSMRSAIPADQLGETAYNHVVYAAPFQRADGPLGDDPRASMRSPQSAEQSGETPASHTVYSEHVEQHYRPGDGHASMRGARPASQLGE